MAEQITSGQTADGQAHAYPIAQEAHDDRPVYNIPPNAGPPQSGPPPNPYNSTLTSITIDGQTQQVTQEKLIELAQKGVSSATRYQEAASLNKEAQEAITHKADMELLAETGDINAFRRAGASIGLSGDQIEEAARIVYEGVEDEERVGQSQVPFPGEDQLAARGGSGGVVDQRIASLEAELQKTQALLGERRTGFGDLSQDLQTAITDVEQNRVDKIIQNALDKDGVITYYMNSMDEKGKAAILNMIDEKVRGRLDASDGAFGDGTRILQEVVPEVRETLEAIGTSNRTTPQMGLGPSPGGQGADIYPRTMPDHVPSTEAGFEDHIAQVLAHNEFRAQQGGQ